MTGSSRVVVSQFAVLTEPIARGLRALASTGVPAVEVFMEGPQWWRADAVDQLATACTAFPGAISVHPPSWDVNIASYTAPVRDTAIEVYCRAVEVARSLRATYAVIHVGWRGDPSLPRADCLQRAEEAIQRLASIARAAGVVLAVENVGWSGQEICDQEEFTTLASRLPEGVGVLLDVGHAHLAGWDLPRALRALAPRMVAVHLHDNDGVRDRHLPIEQGNIAWDGLWPLLRTLPPTCQYVVEYAPGTPLHWVREGAALVARRLSW